MDQKRINIIKSVGRLYHRYGVKSVTMDDVALDLGISKKTLYQFFNDKETLVREVISYHMENPEFNLNEVGSGNPIDRLFALRNHLAGVLKVYNNNLEYDLRKQYPDIYSKFSDFKRQKIFTDTIMNMEEGQKQGLFRNDINTDVIARLLVGRMLFTMNPEQGIFDESELASIDLFDKVMDYHMHGICTEKGLDYYKKQLNNLKNEKKI